MCNNENTGSRQKNPVRNIDSSQKNVNRKDTIMIENQDNVLTDQKLTQVTGGDGNDRVSGGDDNDWHSWKLVEVKDGPNNSALCPYCAGVKLSYDGRATLFNKKVWRFHCPKCSKKFIKIVAYGQWRVRI